MCDSVANIDRIILSPDVLPGITVPLKGTSI